MKKLLSIVMALMLAVSLVCSMSALPENRLEEPGRYGTNMPEVDYHILKTDIQPTIDGTFEGENVWGEPIFDITGEDAYWFTRERDYFNSLYVSWAITSSNLWTKTDGSVELIRNAHFTGYARWDDANLYLCFVVEGITYYDEQYDEYYYPDNYDFDNGKPTWYGNGIQISFGPENPELNWDEAAANVVGIDPITGEEAWVKEAGYVGNEYLLAMTNQYGSGTKDDPIEMAIITRGKYADKVLPGQELRRGNNSGSEYAVRFDVTKMETGYQVYEMSFPFQFMHCSAEQGQTEGIPFAVAFNVQGTDKFEEAAFNGFQVGSGIYQQDKRKIFDSMRLVFVTEEWSCPEHIALDGIANCMAQAKCIYCDTRIGDYGPHSYDIADEEIGFSACIYCGQCEVHNFDEEGVCTVCGYREVVAGQILVGDLDGSGEINAKDSTLLKRYLAGWDIAAQVKDQDLEIVKISGDSDQNGDISAKDATLLSRYLASWEVDCAINTVVPGPVAES